MQFCQDHWDRLREKIEAAGLGHLIAKDGRLAAEQMADQLRRGETGDEDVTTPVNYDPLMSAHWAIANNCFRGIDNAGGNPLYLMAPKDEPEDEVDPSQCRNEPSRKTWPRCPLCYLNLAHEVSCTDPRCQLEKVNGYDHFLDRAVADEVERVREMDSDRPA